MEKFKHAMVKKCEKYPTCNTFNMQMDFHTNEHWFKIEIANTKLEKSGGMGKKCRQLYLNNNKKNFFNRKIRGNEHAHSLGWNVNWNLSELNWVTLNQIFNVYALPPSNASSSWSHKNHLSAQRCLQLQEIGKLSYKCKIQAYLIYGASIYRAPKVWWVLQVEGRTLLRSTARSRFSLLSLRFHCGGLERTALSSKYACYAFFLR